MYVFRSLFVGFDVSKKRSRVFRVERMLVLSFFTEICSSLHR